MIQKKYGFSRLILPLSILVFLAFAMFVERSGISYKVRHKPSSFLDPLSSTAGIAAGEIAARESDCLVLVDSQGVGEMLSFQTVTSALDSMKIPYFTWDVSDPYEINFDNYESVIVTFIQLEKFKPYISDMMVWLNDGGKLLFAIRPDNTPVLSDIYAQLGISDLDKGYIKVSGVEFLTDLLPGVAAEQFGSDFKKHTSLPVSLSVSTELHIISADGLGLPILWETKAGLGKVVFINSDQFIEKGDRGIIGAAYSLLHDVFIYPVINSAVFYIDDFPAPVPEGINEEIFRQFNRDIESFFINVWWTDMQSLQDKYKMKYSTVMIETYKYDLQPPFEYTGGQSDLMHYFGGSVLRDGGEIGLHGYNHIPLCKEEDGFNQALDYPSWDSSNDMQAAVAELQRFRSTMFPEQLARVYVPVSNILCPEAREWMTEALPDLRVIASVYLPDKEVPAYVQEFTEAEDGIIEFPRITAGYNPDNFMRWVSANELWLHYTFGHFIHPDDVLDSYRNKGKSWTALRETLDEFLLWIYSSAPGIRNMTASEGAMAVQRFNRLLPEYECGAGECHVTLNGFYDEAWLMMRSKKTPSSITSGEITRVSENLYLIEAIAPNLLIGFEE